MIDKELLTTFVAAYAVQPATAYWRAIEIDAILRYGLPEGLGLDLGCGDGILTDILLRRAGKRKFVGIDPDPLEAKAAETFSFYERVHVAYADAIPEKDGTFDFVLSNSVLEHIPDLENAIAEIARLLRSEGRFIFTVPAPAFHLNLRGPLAPGITRRRYLNAMDRRLAHHHYLSTSDWKDLLARHGMNLDACLGYLDAGQTRRWESLSRMTGGLLYSVFGETRRPIEIQRSLGMRDFQNSSSLPRPLAATIANMISFGVPSHSGDSWHDEDTASCLLVAGRRN